MWGYGPGMMGYGWGMGFSMLFGGIFWIVVVMIGVWAVAQLLRSPDRAPAHEKRSSALDVLEERYARGEIGRDEYLQKKQDIRAPSSGK